MGDRGRSGAGTAGLDAAMPWQPERPAISLPTGGGAIRGIGESFTASPATGTGATSVPIALSPGRAGFAPTLALGYDSGTGNGPFGLGWSLSTPAVTRRTDKGLPRYRDDEDSDTFLLTGSDDLLPMLRHDPDGSWIAAHPGHARDADGWVRDAAGHAVVHEDEAEGFRVRRYRPRAGAAVACIERWSRPGAAGDVHWRVLSRDNVLSVYGLNAESRIVDPADPARIFSWLIRETRDDKGNAILYRYRAEDGEGVDTGALPERGRGPRDDPRRAAQRYLKRILYGNRTPLTLADGTRPRFLDPAVADADNDGGGWAFEAVIDYGDHDAAVPRPRDDAAITAGGTARFPWPVRPDPHAGYRAGFELRSLRRARRVLMFHHFPAAANVGRDCLVRSTDFTYADEEGGAAEEAACYSRLAAVTQRGYARDGAGYSVRALPAVEFAYAPAVLGEAVQALDADSLETLPAGLAPPVRWVDLYGDGAAGILREEGGAWHFRRNLGALPSDPPGGASRARFGPVETVAERPSASLAGRAIFADLDGDGRAELVVMAGAAAGAWHPVEDGGGLAFRPFTHRPNLDERDAELRFIDLVGDGRPDILITEEDALVWHPSLGSDGFGPARRMALATGEEAGPRVLFSDGDHAIHLADLSGDGLADIVRIRNGEVSYWPNLGHGRFDARVAMADAPLFDRPERFDGRRVRLADIDGSGTADIVYLHPDGARLYFNRSGNGWGPARALAASPPLHDLAEVSVLDLLGTGTASLVWSSPLPDGPALRYVELMAAGKPHLLTGIANNLGAETRIAYIPSTRFQQLDRAAGRPWAGRLPFPVQVVERIERIDHVARTRLVSRFAYHHGHFDGVEREFRGFGMVEQVDSEDHDAHRAAVEAIGGTQATEPELHQPPVTTRTWHHLGTFAEQQRMLASYHDEWHGAPLLPPAALPGDAAEDEWRQCARAMRGLALRREVFSFDGTVAASTPYLVSETRYGVTRLQPPGSARPGVYAATALESVTFEHDRVPDDPRIVHALVLDQDELGHPREACTVHYGRRQADPAVPPEVAAAQARSHVAIARTGYTPDLTGARAPRDHRIRIACEWRQEEVTGIAPDDDLFALEELRAKLAAAAPIAFDTIADEVTPQRRPTGHSRLRFRGNDLAPLPQGEWDTLGLAHRGYRLAFTAASLATHYGAAIGPAELAAGGYVQEAGDDGWWAPSGVSLHAADARAHFFLPIGSADAMGLEQHVAYDADLLLIERTTMPAAPWSAVTAVNDYRVLGPVMTTDANGNRAAVRHDELGLVTRTALMGKPGAGEGDTLDEPTTRVDYDLDAWRLHRLPARSHGFERERHGAANPGWRETLVYSDGNGRAALTKTRAAPGKALAVEAGAMVERDADPRWIGDGRVQLNNKGDPVRRFEPWFSTTADYEDDDALRRHGVSATLHYDPLSRLIRTDLPDGTRTEARFSPWRQTGFDANDLALGSAWHADRGSPDPAGPEPLDDPERRAAWLAARHHDTPATVHLDALGRPIATVADLGGGVRAISRIEAEPGGRWTRAFDPLGREVASGFVAIGGTPMLAASAEKGRRRIFQNVRGGVARTWDEHGRAFRVAYDALGRPVATFVREGGGAERVYGFVVHGDRLADAAARNLIGATHLAFDGAGMTRVARCDFRGTPDAVERVLLRDHRATADWTALVDQPDAAAVLAAAAPLLDDEVFSAATRYDALGRAIEATLPDGTRMLPAYDAGGALTAVAAALPGEAAARAFLADATHDAHGRRLSARHASGVALSYAYDPASFRLTGFTALPPGGDPLLALRYTYDPVGNITETADAAQQTRYFNNAAVPPVNRYEYDAAYQLVRASGRELAGAIDAGSGAGDLAAVPLPHANDAAALRSYSQDYQYDLAGNIRALRHRFKPQAGVGDGWVRRYRYASDDLPGDRTNRLTATSLPGDAEGGPYSATYAHDAYGNMIRMPHLALLEWDALDRLRRCDTGNGESAWHSYDAGGERVRRVVERGAMLLEWIYLGSVMLFRRRRRTGERRFERWTTHVTDDDGAVAQIDVKRLDEDGEDPANPLGVPLIRYQLGDRLGSTVIELDEAGRPVSREEYHPFGTTAYRSVRPGEPASRKRFRFAGKERDDESGLYAFGPRFLAPWLGRWISSDPAGFADGFNLFAYCRNNPVSRADPDGTDSEQIVGIGTPPEAIRKALRTNSPAARAKLEKWYADNAFADPDDPNVFLMYRPGSLTWNAEKKQNWGVFDRIVAEEVTVTGEKPPPPEGPHGNVGSAVTTHDSYQRKVYEKADAANSKAAQAAIADAQAEGNPTKAMEEAENVSSLRNDGRKQTQGKVSPAAKRLSEWGEGPRDFERMKQTYSERLPSSEAKTMPKAVARAAGPTTDEFEIARRIAVASGQPRWYFAWAGKVGRTVGPLGVGLSGYALVNDLAERDYSMAAGDALSVVGSGLEVYALFGGGAAAMVGGVSAVTLGIVIGGVGLAITSGISAHRAWQRGDKADAAVGLAGVAAGAALATGGGILLASAAGVAVGAGAVAAAPFIIGAGLVVGAGVGVYHFGGWLKRKLF